MVGNSNIFVAVDFKKIASLNVYDESSCPELVESEKQLVCKPGAGSSQLINLPCDHIESP